MSEREEVWESSFMTTRRLSERIERELKTARGISLPEYNVLVQLARAGDAGLRPGALARQVVLSPSRLTHTLHRMRDRGLVKRARCDTDARGGVITLTAAGHEEFRASARVHCDIVHRLVLDVLEPGDTQALAGVFGRIGARLDEDD